MGGAGGIPTFAVVALAGRLGRVDGLGRGMLAVAPADVGALGDADRVRERFGAGVLASGSGRDGLTCADGPAWLDAGLVIEI